MKQWKKYGILVLLVLLAMPALGFDAALRRGAPTLDVSVEDIVLEDGRFSMTANQGGSSGTAFRRSAYEIKDGALYVTLFSGLVYGDFRQDRLDVEIQDSALDEVRQVYLRNNLNTRLIYSK